MWSYFSRTLKRLVSYYSQYKACILEVSTESKVRKTVFKTKKFLTFNNSKNFFLIHKFFPTYFFSGRVDFFKLQSIRSTASSLNKSFREFEDYIEDIEVSEIPFEFQNS